MRAPRLERIMKTTFMDIGDVSGNCEYDSSSSKALRSFNAQIEELGRRGDLTEQKVWEIIDHGRSLNRQVVGAVGQILAARIISWPTAGGRRAGQVPYYDKLLEPGFSAVITDDNGDVRAAIDAPNNDPVLASYGPGLMWAFMKNAQERYAQAWVGQTASMRGYRALLMGLEGQRPGDVAYKDLPHVGGYSEVPKIGEMIYRGVSGVMLTEHGLRYLEKHPLIIGLADRARAVDAIGGFEGNLFAGSIDSTVARLMLSDNYTSLDVPGEIVTDIDNRNRSGYKCGLI